MESIIKTKAKNYSIRYPNLQTVLMVERFIKEHNSEFKKMELFEKLPKKMMYQTFSVIIDYLLYAVRIAVDREGKIAWIWDPKGVKKYLKKKHLMWRG